MKQSNYELTKRRMQGHFLDFDQNTMIRRFGLQHDAEYLYIRFVGRLYRIDRKAAEEIHENFLDWYYRTYPAAEAQKE